jgi:hypothetical protein
MYGLKEQGVDGKSTKLSKEFLARELQCKLRRTTYVVVPSQSPT